MATSKPYDARTLRAVASRLRTVQVGQAIAAKKFKANEEFIYAASVVGVCADAVEQMLRTAKRKARK